MRSMRHGNTGIEMVNSGSWIKVGKKHYRHESGIEVRYDCNRYIWIVSTQPNHGYSTLWVARYEAEKDSRTK